MGSVLNKTGGFSRDERIKRSVEIQNLFKHGKRVSVKGAKLFVLPNGREFNRIAFTLPRGYGNAVERNCSKRYSRETYRCLKNTIIKGWDLLFLVYPGNDSFTVRYTQFSQLCKKIGLLEQ